MASLDHRLNPLFSIKECSSCGALYTADFCCSKGGLEDKILVPKPSQNCATCGEPVDGLYCRPCAFVRKCLNEAPIISNPEQCNQTINELPQTLPSVHPTCISEDENSFTYDSKHNFVDDSPNVFNPPPQPYLNSCEFCGNDARYCHYYYYHEQNSCYDPNSFGFDKFQPPQYTVNHPIFNYQNILFNAQNEFLNSQNKLMEQMTSICDMVGQIMQKKEEEKRIAEEQAAKDRYWKIPICYDDDEEYTIAITPDLPTKEPEYSLIMGDEHLSTIPEKESDELIKSSVENLVPIPSESEVTSDKESECDVPVNDETSPTFTTFSNPLFDSNDDFTSSDDESLSDEDVPKENFKIYSNPLFDEEIISDKIDALIISSPKIDSLLEQLLYDNSSPHPLEELNSTGSFPLSHISIEDSDPFMEEIDLYLASDESIPPGIDSDYSERPRVLKIENGAKTGYVTTKEKVQKNNDMKARSMLLMALPNEHLLTFNQYKDAKTLFAAIQTRFGEDCKSAGYSGNKPDLNTMSFDDLYNNFKIVEQEQYYLKVNTAYGVSTANTQVSPASTQVSTASTQVSTANLSDDTVYAFLASQPNGSQLVYEDLEQIHEDDIKRDGV
ncbi:hypothetical protein Tco_0403824 [Tanacetum coccineum]